MTFARGSIMRSAGLLAGCLASVALLAAGRMPAGTAAGGVQLELSAHPITEVGVSPAGRPFLAAADLAPHTAPASGALTLTNHTGRRLTAALRVTGGARDLDRLVRLTVAAGDEELFAGRLGELRDAGRLQVRVPARSRATLAVSAAVEPRPRREYQGRAARLRLVPAVAGGKR